MMSKDHMLLINLAAFLEKSKVNGPGARAVLWVQGCPIHCPGCFNPQMWSFSPKMLVSVNKIAERILSYHEKIAGITLSGGEPFAQADALGALGEIIQRYDMDIITFTGYTLNELHMSDRNDWNRLLAVTDLLVAGPFINDLACNNGLYGSSNQQLTFLSDRLRQHDYFTGVAAHSVEFIINKDGTFTTTGFPAYGMVE